MTRRRDGSLDLERALETSYWREAEARAVLRALAESGESLSGFATRHGIEPGRLRRWEKRLGGGADLTFHPVAILDPGRHRAETAEGRNEFERSGALVLVLRGGRRVVVGSDFDADLLRRLVATVESWC